MQFYRRIKLHNLQLSQLIYLSLQIYKSIFKGLLILNEEKL